MNTITTTNIRVGPGVYMAVKEMADKTGLSIGTWANLLIVSMLYTNDKSLSGFSPETQKALVADMLVALSEFFKVASWETIKNTSIADLYQSLLGRPKTPQKTP
jgi:hypothetical protein